MKKRIFAIAMIMMCLAIIACGTLAYFTDSATVNVNIIKTGNIDIQLNEWADVDKTIPFPEEGIKDVMPGREITKIVEVENIGKNSAYIRVLVTKDIQLQDGVDAEVDTSLLILDYDEATWTYNEADGYYYYNEPLEPGNKTEPLFASVTVDKDMSNEYHNCTAFVNVYAFAVQSNYNGDTALEANGWLAPEE